MSAFQELKIAVRNHTILEFNFCSEKTVTIFDFFSFTVEFFQIVCCSRPYGAVNKKYLIR